MEKINMEKIQGNCIFFSNGAFHKKLSKENDLTQKLKHQIQKLLSEYPNVADILTLYTPHALSEEESEAMIKVLILKEELSRVE